MKRTPRFPPSAFMHSFWCGVYRYFNDASAPIRTGIGHTICPEGYLFTFRSAFGSARLALRLHLPYESANHRWVKEFLLLQASFTVGEYILLESASLSVSQHPRSMEATVSIIEGCDVWHQLITRAAQSHSNCQKAAVLGRILNLFLHTCSPALTCCYR